MQNAMPTILELRVLIEKRITLSETVGEFHFRILESILKLGSEIYYDSVVAESDDEILPLRIVAPEGGFKGAERKAIEEGRPFNMYVATLDEPAFETVVQGISEITRNNSRFSVHDIPARLIVFNTIRSKLYRDFLKTRLSNKIKITSDMPVLIDIDKENRLPELGNVFEKAESSWEYFSPEKLPDKKIRISKIKEYKIQGKETAVGDRDYFSIKCESLFELDPADEDGLRKANALLRFIEFSGIGLLKRYGYGSLRITFY